MQHLIKYGDGVNMYTWPMPLIWYWSWILLMERKSQNNCYIPFIFKLIIQSPTCLMSRKYSIFFLKLLTNPLLNVGDPGSFHNTKSSVTFKTSGRRWELNLYQYCYSLSNHKRAVLTCSCEALYTLGNVSRCNRLPGSTVWSVSQQASEVTASSVNTSLLIPVGLELAYQDDYVLWSSQTLLCHMWKM